MQEQLLVTRLLNQIFGPAVCSFLNALHIPLAVPCAPFTNAYALELCVALALIAFFVAVRLTLSVESPGPIQYVAELIHGFVGSNGEQIIGPTHARFQSFVTCIFLFVVCNNILGLVPGIDTPTASPVVPLGIALLTFLYYNFYGVKEQGVIGYMKEFAGPIWWVVPLLFPIEIVSHLARIMSLTIRLYANMFASDLVTLVFFALVPLAVPSVFLGLHFFVSLIQAYVFMLLAMIYLSQAVSHEH
jgi:F-type H+-transporting ATPase subunit a